MGRLFKFIASVDGSAAAEMALVSPILLVLAFGSMEVGNYFLNEHAVAKAVRDGARFGSRMTIDADYDCPATVFEDADYADKIKNVTKTGTVDGTGTGRFPAAFWGDACPGSTALDVSVRCVPKTGYSGIYASLAGDIPVVKVSANIEYSPVLASLGLSVPSICLRAESEAAVAGL